jgi:hypothetical protein
VKQEDFDETVASGLASMYPTFDWSVVLQAIMDISAPAFSLRFTVTLLPHDP